MTDKIEASSIIQSLMRQIAEYAQQVAMLRAQLDAAQRPVEGEVNSGNNNVSDS